MEQLKLLMDYTVFHIGVYITLGGLMISLLGSNIFAERMKTMRCYIVAALGCFLIAGIFGGIVAGNLPYFTKFSDFTEASIGPWIATHALPASFCMKAEHTAFWLGIAVFLFGFWKSGKA